LTWLALPANGQVVEENPEEFEGMGVTEHLGDTIPLDLVFTNDHGEQVQLGEYFHQGKPVLLTLVYFNCPMLCNLILNGVNEAIAGLDFNPGDEYEIVTISFNPRETAELAAAKKKNYLEQLGRPGVEDGWMFHVGSEDQTRALADAVGFEYYWDEEQQQFAHPSVIYVLTEEGRISRYLYGISFQPRDMKLALVEASDGKIGSTVDQLLLYCFHYDPDARGYVAVAGNIMKLGGLATLVVLSGFIGLLWARERRKKTTDHDTVHSHKQHV
jgi:protein SCO1/2